MRELQLKLKDKTVVISGPLNSITQALSTVLTEFGANVAYITNEYDKVLKFTENVNISRESNPSNGKAIAIEADIKTSEAVTDTFGKVAEFYGTVDAIIDAYLLDTSRFSKQKLSELSTSDFCNQLFQPTECLVQGGMPYLTGRKKGRFLVLNYKTPQRDTTVADLDKLTQQSLLKLKSNISTDIAGSQVTFNCLLIGPTEDYLLNTYPDLSSVKDSLGELQKTYPKAKIVEATDVAQAVAFFISPLSAAINNICLELDYGIDYK